MKKIIYICLFAALSAMGSSCTDMLKEESTTNIPVKVLYDTPEGLSRAVNGLYDLDRNLPTVNKDVPDGDYFCMIMLDLGTDIYVFRGGTAATYARLSGLTASDHYFSTVWTYFYEIIGRSNDVITMAEQMDMKNPLVKNAWSEAKMFRARSYFELYKRYERLYLTTEMTTVDNMNRDFKPAPEADVLKLIRDDLEDAIEGLPWTNGTDRGRWTKAVAKHVRAQVAMWEKDWGKAIKECEDIFADPNYGMMDHAIECFQGADLSHREILYAYQWSPNVGGGGVLKDDGTLQGHGIAMHTNAAYHAVAGMTYSAEYDGYGYGRIYPNKYLFSLYDQQKDIRYKNLFRHEWRYNNPKTLPAGKNIGDVVEPASGTQYITNLHPMSLKWQDHWTNAEQLDRKHNFKDLPLYRLAETYLMAAEAYFERDGGSSPKAIEYYNKTWHRDGHTGNDYFNGPLTGQILLDEYARELHFEGVRWSLLKRRGVMKQQVTQYSGDTKVQDPKLASDLILTRQNFEDKHTSWPIPQRELDMMGPGFPQSEAWKIKK